MCCVGYINEYMSQWTCNVTLMLVRVTIVAVETQ